MSELNELTMAVIVKIFIFNKCFELSLATETFVKIYLLLFYVQECLLACINVHYPCAWCPWRLEGIGRSGAGMAVHCHVGAGNRTWSSVRGVSTEPSL